MATSLFAFLSIVCARSIATSVDKVCISGSQLSTTNGIYEYQNHSTYFNSATSQYLYRSRSAPPSKDYLISSDPTKNTAISYCNIPSTSTTSITPDDCYNANGDQWTSLSSSDSWVQDTDLRMLICNDICIANSNEPQINGVYEWIDFDATLATSIYYCASCNLYLFGWIFENSNNYQWRIAPNYSDPLSSPMARCKLATQSAETYKFELDDCNEWELYDTNSNIWISDENMLANDQCSSNHTKPSIVIENHADCDEEWVAFYLRDVDEWCDANILDVEIQDSNNSAAEWIAFDPLSLEWDYYAFWQPALDHPFVLPISVRLTVRTWNDEMHELYACDVITSFDGANQFVFGANLCDLSYTNSTNCSSENNYFIAPNSETIAATKSDNINIHIIWSVGAMALLIGTSTWLCYCRKRKNEAEKPKEMRIVHVVSDQRSSCRSTDKDARDEPGHGESGGEQAAEEESKSMDLEMEGGTKGADIATGNEKHADSTEDVHRWNSEEMYDYRLKQPQRVTPTPNAVHVGAPPPPPRPVVTEGK